MAVEEGLFGKYKQCEFCGRPLPKNYEGELCPRCKDNHLFNEVKHFIRSNNVNEYEVAAHFGIPLKQVKEWIRDGRIEYRTKNAASNVSALHRQQCGAPITFGTLCPKCLKVLNQQGSSSTLSKNHNMGSDSRMHYLDNEN